MSDSWRAPRRLLLLALGSLTVFYLVAPMLVIVPMSFTAGQSLSWPPQGFSIQWYQKMVTDQQWSRGFLNSAEVASLTAVVATVIGTLAGLGIVRGRFPGKGL